MKRLFPLFILLVCAVSASAQESGADAPSATSGLAAVIGNETPPADKFLAERIPANSSVYIAPMLSEDTKKPFDGFESYLAAAMRKKNVPLLIVSDPSQADFIIQGTADKKGAGWAKKVFLSDWRSTTSAALTVTNRRTGVVAFADASHRGSANRGMRSSAEKLAKYLKKKMDEDEKKFKLMPAAVQPK
jgi:hypothetical protein